MAVLSTTEVLGRTHLELEAVDRVARTSSRLKGGLVKALKDATAHVRVILETIERRLRSDPLFTSAPAPSRVFLENLELRAEMTRLRAEVAALRDGARMPPPPPPSATAKSQGGLSEESLLSTVETLLERKLLGICPPFHPSSRSKGAAPAARGGKKGPGKPPPHFKSRSVSRTREGGAPSSSSRSRAGKPAGTGPEKWAKVVGRKAKRQVKAQAKTAAQPLSEKATGGKGPAAKPPGEESKKAPGGAKRLRVPSTAAIAVSAVREGASLADAMKAFREALPDPTGRFGIDKMVPKRSVAGNLLILIPGEGREDKARALSSWMREYLEAHDLGVAVTCPSKTGKIRLEGFDLSVTPVEVVASVAQAGGCREDLVRIGKIRTNPSGHCACWARCPIGVAKRLRLAKRVKVGGWFWASVEVLPPRPLRCYRCLCTGHVQRHCPSEKDRSGLCFRCGAPDHGAGACTADQPKCPLCSDLGRKSVNHRLDGPACPPVLVKPGPRAAPSGGAARTSSPTLGGKQRKTSVPPAHGQVHRGWGFCALADTELPTGDRTTQSGGTVTETLGLPLCARKRVEEGKQQGHTGEEGGGWGRKVPAGSCPSGPSGCPHH